MLFGTPWALRSPARSGSYTTFGTITSQTIPGYERSHAFTGRNWDVDLYYYSARW